MAATCWQTARPLTRGKAPFSAEARKVCLLSSTCGGEPVCACKTMKGGSSMHMCFPGSLVIVQCDGGFALQTVDSCVQQCKHMQLGLLSTASVQQHSVGKLALLLPPLHRNAAGISQLCLERMATSHITVPIMGHSNLVHFDFMSHQNGPSGHFWSF